MCTRSNLFRYTRTKPFGDRANDFLVSPKREKQKDSESLQLVLALQLSISDKQSGIRPLPGHLNHQNLALLHTSQAQPVLQSRSPTEPILSETGIPGMVFTSWIPRILRFACHWWNRNAGS